MKLSVIIPVLNEAGIIEKLVSYLRTYGGDVIREIIVVDGGSTDQSTELASGAGALTVQSPGKGRAAQMNYGASHATGDILYFIHADTLPPRSFVADILSAMDNGYKIGRYKTRFDSPRFLLKINAFFTRFDWFMCMGGDQTLFITRELFQQTGGFDGTMRIMEEFEFCQRARQGVKYKIMEGTALISARKYETNSWLRVQRANYTIVKMYRRGASQEALVKKYREMLDYR